MKRLLISVLLLTVGCSAPPVADLRGEWGGEHVSLTITDAGSSLEFDCARGAIPGPFAVDAAGRFNLSGIYTPGTGGPEPITPRPSQAAAYTGRVSGQRMTLTVELEGSLPGGTYELRKDEPPQLFRCL
jgi:hypothetical protein